jgi:anti-anti-sigma regulatory factor
LLDLATIFHIVNEYKDKWAFLMSEYVIELPTELTIVQVDEFKNEILPHIDANNAFTIEDNKIARIDTIGVQFLLALVTYIEAQHKTLSWPKVTSIIKKSIKHLGIQEHILTQYISE